MKTLYILFILPLISISSLATDIPKWQENIYKRYKIPITLENIDLVKKSILKNEISSIDNEIIYIDVQRQSLKEWEIPKELDWENIKKFLDELDKTALIKIMVFKEKAKILWEKILKKTDQERKEELQKLSTEELKKSLYWLDDEKFNNIQNIILSKIEKNILRQKLLNQNIKNLKKLIHKLELKQYNELHTLNALINLEDNNFLLALSLTDNLTKIYIDLEKKDLLDNYINYLSHEDLEKIKNYLIETDNLKLLTNHIMQEKVRGLYKLDKEQIIEKLYEQYQTGQIFESLNDKMAIFKNKKHNPYEKIIDEIISKMTKDIKILQAKKNEMKIDSNDSKKIRKFPNIRRAGKLIYDILNSMPLLVSYPNTIEMPKKDECYPKDLRFRILFLSNKNSVSGTARRLEYNPALDLCSNNYSKVAGNKLYDEKIIKGIWQKQVYVKTDDQLLSYITDTQSCAKGQFIFVLSWGNETTLKGMRYFTLTNTISKDDLKDQRLEINIKSIEWERIKVNNDQTILVPNIAIGLNLSESDIYLNFTKGTVLTEGHTKQTCGYTIKSENDTLLLDSIFSDENLGKSDIN